MIVKYAESLCDHFTEYFFKQLRYNRIMDIMIFELIEEKLDEKKLMKSLVEILRS